jgi:hypothetical protein
VAVLVEVKMVLVVVLVDSVLVQHWLLFRALPIR